MDSIPGAALNFGNHRHCSDHLAPICLLLQIPLLVSDPSEAEFLQKLYPGLMTEVWERETLSLRRLFDTFSLFIQSEYWPRPRWEVVKTMYGGPFGKHRNLHCPHGFSDKRFWLAQAAQEDGTLYYGPLMQTCLREEGMEETRQIWCGNYRATYYTKYRSQMDAICQERVWSRFFKQQPCILYAPTCLDQELSTTFFEITDFVDNLPPEYNLLVKLHPALAEKAPWEVEEFMHRYRACHNVLVLDQFPLVYPILSRIFAYVGDMSSIGYDLLSQGKPMFFLKNSPSVPVRPLERAGISLPLDKASTIYALLDTPPDAAFQMSLYEQAFGPSLSWEELSCHLKTQVHAWMSMCCS